MRIEKPLNKPSNHHWLLYLGWGLLGLWLLFICWPYFIKLPVQNESTFLYEGYLITLGKLPYRDFFDFILPGIFYLVAGLIKLFGVSMVAFRLTALAMILGCIAITLHLARAFLPRWGWITLGLLLWVFHLPTLMELQHHLCSAFTGMLALLCLWHATLQETGQRPKFTLLAGFLIGLTTLFTQTLGVTLGVALGAFLLVYRMQHEKQPFGRSLLLVLTNLTLPALLPIALTYGYFASQGALGNLWDSTFTYLARGNYAATTSHIYFLDGWNRLFSYSKVLFRNGPITLNLLFMILSGILPLVGLIWPPAHLLKKRWRHGQKDPSLSLTDWRLLYLWMAGIGFFLAIFSYPNTRMVLWHAWPLYLLAWVAIQGIWQHRPTLQKTFGVVLILGILASLCLSTNTSLNLLNAPRVISYGTRESGLTSEASSDYIEASNQLLRLLHEQSPPGTNLFVYNGAPELYFLTHRDNPTRYQILMAIYNTPEQIEEALRDLRRKKPTFILYNRLDELDFRFDQRFLKWRNYDFHLYGLETILVKDYQLAGELQNILVFKRKDR